MHLTCIKFLSDNPTAMAYIKNMGGTHSRQCNITREILLWCKAKGLTLLIAHLLRKLNIEADKASRLFINDDTEWSLVGGEYSQLVALWGRSSIDKVTPYVAWKPDPGSSAIDTFTFNWSDYSFSYCFPPFSLIGKVLLTTQMSKATAI